MATDIHTDIGRDIEFYKCGFSIISGNSDDMQIAINKIISNNNLYEEMKCNAYSFLIRKFNVNLTTNLILNASINK